ncbi:hypothetical protein TAMA11512_23170 [Selenomonas sp. TAMA-11512]|uniref:hypothetical protein n=1 Tax=Selenomonas sp. TAMA-11512 TaxID=3095337 RepID=UPI003085F212|nr:hypothetical protein TAMA11512_23170 [Selenomonas sp. TAMA-11512]
MKTRIPGLFCTAILAAGILIVAASTALAHSMPSEEATIILPKPPYGQLDLVPHKSTLSDARAGFGSAFKGSDFTGDGMRFVSYKYGNDLTFFARTGAQDRRPADELTITGYDVMSSSLHTPSRFSVSDPYQQVVDKYGEASYTLEKEDGLTSYIYSFNGRPTQLIFDVNASGVIRAIRYRTEA